MNTAVFNHNKYRMVSPVNMPQRHWPEHVLTQAPVWCSVDLRDGNQALKEPLNQQQKLTYFKMLVQMGFKEIEVGFPSASDEDFNFVRTLIEEQYIPDDVTIAVLTPAREVLIKRTFRALEGISRALVHMYNSTSKVQREQVFGLDKGGIINIAVNGAQAVRACAQKQPETDWRFQYSPESFTATELDFAVQICNAVNDVWQPEPDKPVVINLPATVETSMPNVYADQVEWFIAHIHYRDSVIISVHTHNDRGCAVAAAELALLAGAQRVEGTLLGNGERTGNVDLITMAMNLYSQGIDPELHLSEIQSVSERISHLIQMAIHPRHPYIGELVYTAFSGSHQDAINKCLKNYQSGQIWEVAYLPIDPADLGRSYEEVIRINSQSGKGGVAWIIEQSLGTQIPRWLQTEFSQLVQRQAEKTGSEISSEWIVDLFVNTYMQPKGLFQIYRYQAGQVSEEEEQTEFVIQHLDKRLKLYAQGVGILNCFISALSAQFTVAMDIIEYSEQTLQPDSSARAIAFVRVAVHGQNYTGVAENEDIVMASLNAILQAVSEYILS